MSRNEDADRFHSRKNPRLEQFDYRSPNYYFITICTRNKVCLFGEPDACNYYGCVAEEKLKEIPRHFPGVALDQFVVMPNHIHAILILSGDSNLSSVVGLYKSAVTRELRKENPEIRVWQTSFHDHIIRNQADYERIWNYIHTNPARWMDDCFYTPESGKESGLIGGVMTPPYKIN